MVYTNIQQANQINTLQEGLTYDDVLLIPQFSDIHHRSEVSLNTKILPGLEIEIPCISSNMDTVTEYQMIFAMAKYGGLGILHRYLDLNEMLEQIQNYRNLCKEENITEKPFVVSIGVHDPERVELAYQNNIRNFCIDVAHGHHILVKDKIQFLRKKYGNEIGIIAGNVASYEGALALYEWGADCIKVGIGPGSVCTTRIKTGCGYPQLSAILQASQARDEFCRSNQGERFIIADGGVKVYGDITKALAAGADAVMLGSIFAGCKETPGTVWRNENEEITKSYRGMASAKAQSEFGIEDINEEGVALTVKYRGSIRHILPRISKGVRSGLSYCGSRSIKELQNKAKFVKITQSSYLEGKPHKAYNN